MISNQSLHTSLSNRRGAFIVKSKHTDIIHMFLDSTCGHHYRQCPSQLSVYQLSLISKNKDVPYNSRFCLRIITFLKSTSVYNCNLVVVVCSSMSAMQTGTANGYFSILLNVQRCQDLNEY